MRRDDREFDDVLKTLDAWDAEPVSRDFDRNLYARLEERPKAWERFASWFGGVRWQPALPAAALVAAYVLLAVSTPREQVRPAAPPPVEQALEDLEMLRQLPILEG